jgi:predicted aminopeptidase
VPRLFAVLLAILLAMLIGGGCRATYLAQLAVEEMRFLRSATPATEMLASAEDPERRRALETLLAVREFAAREGLDVGGSYRAVADMSSAAPFHVVTAAYVDRLAPYTWWYPVIGAIPYRGYFDRAEADRFAAGLRAEGLDTMVVEASAYSTLGWLDDPLPSNVLDRGAGAVVITVLHELVHQTFFAPDAVAFNETLATAIAYRLAGRYYEQKGDAVRAAKVGRAREAWVLRSDVLDATAIRLRSFFGRASQEKWPRKRLMAERAEVYAEVASEIARVDAEYTSSLDAARLDNASFLASHRYATHGRAIDDFLERHPDVRAAIAALKAAQERGHDLYRFVSPNVELH